MPASPWASKSSLNFFTQIETMKPTYRDWKPSRLEIIGDYVLAIVIGVALACAIFLNI